MRNILIIILSHSATPPECSRSQKTPEMNELGTDKILSKSEDITLKNKKVMAF